MKIAAYFLAALPLLATAKEVPDPTNQASDFIRVHRSENQVLLQPAAVTYQKEEIKVTLIGAVHLADQAYFEHLNQHFKTYDRLLYEMIGGERFAEPGKQNTEKKKVKPTPLADTYQLLSDSLELAEQKNEIDYRAKNFVHADLSFSEYRKLQKKRKESLLSFALEAAQHIEPTNDPSPQSLTEALMAGDSRKAKLLLIDALAGGDEAIANLVHPSVIITDRNAKALQVLTSEIKKGHQNLGIFYGAAHLPDLEKSLRALGYQKTKQRWITAWSLTND